MVTLGKPKGWKGLAVNERKGEQGLEDVWGIENKEEWQDEMRQKG